MSDIWSGCGCELYCGDGPGGLAVYPNKADIRAVITDPPYAVMSNTDIQKPKNIKTGHEGRIRRYVGWDDIGDEQYAELMESLFTACAELTDCWVHVFCAAEWLGDLKKIGQACGLRYHMPLIFHKTNPPPRIRKKMWRNSSELSAVFSVGKPEFYDSNAHNFFSCGFESGRKRWHPTQKPRVLMDELVRCYTTGGDLIADPFAGSGQTLLAAMGAKRKAVGWEIDKRQFEVDVVAFEQGIDKARALAVKRGILIAEDADDDESELAISQLELSI